MDVVRSYPTDARVWQCAAIGVAVVVIMRRLTGFRSLSRKYSAEGKTVLITGANSGIGLAAAIEFAKREGRVILACRDVDKAKSAAFKIREKTNKGALVIKHLDLAAQTSVRKFAKDILVTENRLDVLVNNAGVMGLPFSLTEDGIETTFAVNHLGHFLLTNLLLELMKKSHGSRIIIVSSMLYKYGKINLDDINGQNGYTPSGAYSQSKLANIMFGNVLSTQLGGTGVTVNCMSPGIVKTNLARHHVGGSWLKTFLYDTVGPLVLKSPKQGAETILFCGLDPNLKNVTGKFFKNCQEKELRENAKDHAIAISLWGVCSNLTKLTK